MYVVFGSFYDTKAVLRSCNRDHLACIVSMQSKSLKIIYKVFTIWPFKKTLPIPAFHIREDARSTIILEAILLRILWFLFKETPTPQRKGLRSSALRPKRPNAQANWPCCARNLGGRGRAGIMGDQGVAEGKEMALRCDQLLKISVTSEFKKLLLK